MRFLLFLVAGAGLTGGPLLAAPVDITVSDAHGRPLAGAVVFLDSAAARAASKPMPGVEIVQQERRFVPDVTVVTVGSEVAFPNRDTVRHHVYSFSPTKPFELKLYIGKPAHPVSFDKPGIAVLGCNIHDQMVAWVVVLETPHHARSDAQGLARVDAPAGTYTLRVWHPELPPGAPALAQPLTVATSASARVMLAVGGPAPRPEASR